ncbi:HEAT repeat domain-containing protein [Candidatus Nitrosotenuis cloacae]|uniref:HEAT repeat domain-containing protein n=1 Tax=Candidatus Nitrosotenuis cloacae TaxID=1603555 RepID=UPI001F19FADD|nr:HEAT repeat domain-containing protein [Candidatus Nitrosotenuis cloacae]
MIIRELEPVQRLERCREIIQNETDESKRWDAVWLVGEIAENKSQGDPLFDQVADLMEWVLVHDDNNVVKHEACYQIAARDMRSKIPVLVQAALNDKSGLTKHEALESLGLMRATETIDLIRSALDDSVDDVRQTAKFVIKRLARMENAGAYNPSQII